MSFSKRSRCKWSPYEVGPLAPFRAPSWGAEKGHGGSPSEGNVLSTSESCLIFALIWIRVLFCVENRKYFMPKNVRINIQLFVDFIGWCNNSEPSQLFVDKKHQLLNKLKNNSWDGAQICFTILQITGNDLHFLSVLILSETCGHTWKIKNL